MMARRSCSGRERTRPAARYQGYRNLFMLLAIGRRPTAFRNFRDFAKQQIDRIQAQQVVV